MAKKSTKKTGKSTKGQRLNARQEKFVKAYLSYKNATKAAIEAGYSEDSAGTLGYQNLQIPIIRDAIQKELKAQNERLDLTADRILLELYRLATADITEAYDDQGNLKPIKEIPEDVRRSISGVEINELFNHEGDTVVGLTKKLRFSDKARSLEILAKHFKLLTEKHEHKHEFSLEHIVAGSNEDEPKAS